MGDYHVHLHPHGPYDGTGPEPGTYPAAHIEAYVETALSRGVDEVGFTEHLYRCTEAEELLGTFWESEPRLDLADHTARNVEVERTLSLELYAEAVLAARDRGLPVLLGLEVDFFPESIERVAEYLARYPFDFLVGSVHWIGGWGYDRRDVEYEYDRRGTRRAYEDYFALELALAASGIVDILAHVDAIKKPARFLDELPIELYRPVVEAAAASGTAVEINTAGWWHPAAEVFPHPTFLKMFHDAGVAITIGSDAHYPHDTSRAFDRAVEVARKAGYEHRLRFRDRVATTVPLPSPSL